MQNNRLSDYQLIVIWKGRRCEVMGGQFRENGYAFISAVGLEGMKAHRVHIDDVTNPELIKKSEK